VASLHLNNPRDVVPESNMPRVSVAREGAGNADGVAAKMRALRMVGVPYTDEQIAGAKQEVEGKTERTRSSPTSRAWAPHSRT
jgi:cytochrome c oxidase cbb3-type subunit 2